MTKRTLLIVAALGALAVAIVLTLPLFGVALRGGDNPPPTPTEHSSPTAPAAAGHDAGPPARREVIIDPRRQQLIGVLYGASQTNDDQPRGARHRHRPI